MNQIFLLGNVGSIGESKETSGGKVAKFTLAVNEIYKDQKNTTWFNIVCFGKLAEICEKHVTKGMQMLVQGKVQNRTYEKQDGTKGFSSEVMAQTIKFVGKPVGPKPEPTEPSFDDLDEIPF